MSDRKQIELYLRGCAQEVNSLYDGKLPKYPEIAELIVGITSTILTTLADDIRDDTCCIVREGVLVSSYPLEGSGNV